MFRILVPLDGSALAESAIPTAVALARATRARIDLLFVHSDRPAAAILALADELHADAIAMTTQGRGMSRLLVGSVADKILWGAMVPLLLYRPRVSNKRVRFGQRRHVQVAKA